MSFTVKELPENERPYEKLELYGESKLSNSELLAIIIESGTKEKTAIQLAYQVLALAKNTKENELRYLQTVSLEELKEIKGIGKVKAMRLKAAFELARRLAMPMKKDKIVTSSKEVAQIFIEELRYEKKEYVKLVILNNKNRILKIQDISLGGTNYAVIEPKEILCEPVKMGATKIILVHNHPSGNPTPSAEDFAVTKRIQMSAKMLGIDLIDHIVIGDGDYRSAMPT